MNENLGIVLKNNFLQKNKGIVIFDRNFGKIFGIILKNKNINLCNGTLFEYDLQKKMNLNFIDNIKIIDVPFSLAKSNILFLHHILELCFYFLHEGINYCELFDLINLLYLNFDKFEILQTQKLFLCRFFLMLGIYPELQRSIYFDYLMSLPIDRISLEQIDLKNEKELDLWILKSISMYPYIKNLKTINFLTKAAIS